MPNSLADDHGGLLPADQYPNPSKQLLKLIQKKEAKMDVKKLRECVMMAMGHASMCWSDVEKAGDFITQDAIKAGEELIKDILDLECSPDESIGEVEK